MRVHMEREQILQPQIGRVQFMGALKMCINQNLGLWYDASAGNIKYLDSNGKTTNYVSGDATGYMKGMVTSSSDVSACVEAFGADSWLSDSSSDSSSGTGHTAGSIGEGPKGSGSVIGSGSGRNGSGSNSDTTQTKIVPEVTNTTGSNQIKSTFDLTVTTNRSAACQYKQGNTFDYGAGNTFDTTGNTNHSAKLYSLTTGNYTYYVVCKDTATGGVSNALAIAIKVDLALDENNKPIVSNNTSANFTNSTVTLAVNTDRPAKCEYKTNNAFTFGEGTAFATTGSYNHNTDLTNLANGNYIYYAVCQDNATKAVSNPLKITFTVNLPQNNLQVANATSATQTVANPTLAVTTNLTATCRYSATNGFNFNNGTAMMTVDNYAHSASLDSLANGNYTFYVICKANTQDITSSQLTITTTINKSATTDNQPQITNNTASYQTTQPAVISIQNYAGRTCHQYY